jgi:hypothetical protein
VADCVIVDRDGTAASCFMRHAVELRDPDEPHWHPLNRKDWASFNAALPFDAVVPAVVNMLRIVRVIRPDVTIIMTSGRSEGDWPGDRRRRFVMQDWIAKHDLPVDLLLMRAGGDQRADSVVKQEILDRDIRPRFNVLLAIDDRPQVVEMWRANGIPVVQVTDPQLDPFLLSEARP